MAISRLSGAVRQQRTPSPVPSSPEPSADKQATPRRPRLTYGQQHAIRKDLPDGSHSRKPASCSAATWTSNPGGDSCRCLPAKCRVRSVSSGTNAGSKANASHHCSAVSIPRAAKAASVHCSSRTRLAQAPPKLGQRWRSHVVAVEAKAAGPQQATEVVVQTGQRFRLQPMERKWY